MHAHTHVSARAHTSQGSIGGWVLSAPEVVGGGAKQSTSGGCLISVSNQFHPLSMEPAVKGHAGGENTLQRFSERGRQGGDQCAMRAESAHRRHGFHHSSWAVTGRAPQEHSCAAIATRSACLTQWMFAAHASHSGCAQCMPHALDVRSACLTHWM